MKYHRTKLPALFFLAMLICAAVPAAHAASSPLPFTLLFTGNVFGETDPCGG